MNVALDTESSPRPLRADARRNREAILKAARAVFSARGREAHLGDVARRAKVGMGTVYRHFPDKDALLEALAREQFELLTEWAREAVDAPDPGPALDPPGESSGRPSPFAASAVLYGLSTYPPSEL